ncbi:hypothetical protein D3C84_928960 [compost metagenome]
MVGEEDAQGQQQIPDRVPLSELVTVLVGSYCLLDFIDALPDPDRGAGRPTEKIRSDVEQCPPAVTQQCPASLRIGL